MATKAVTETKGKEHEQEELTPAQQAAALLLGRGVGETACSKEMGIHISTLWRWKQLQKFQEAVKRSTDERLNILKAARKEVDEALIAVAQKQDPRASPDRRLYYQLIGALVESGEVPSFQQLVIVRPDNPIQRPREAEEGKKDEETLGEE